MTRSDEEALRVSLTKALDKWVESETENSDLPGCVGFFGGDTTRLMASAAMSVLLAVADVQEHMRDEGVMKDE